MIYLAAPLFNDAARDYAEGLATAILKLGHRVYYPWRDAGDAFYKTLRKREEHWPSDVFSENLSALRRCSLVLAILDGADVDSGVAWEAGFAHASAKPVVGVRSDFRLHANPDMQVNLMLAKACQEIYTNSADLLMYLDRQPRRAVVTVKDAVSFYDTIASEYDDEVLHPHTAALRHAAALLAEALCSRETVDCALDIGAGTSPLISHLSARTKLVVEPSRQMINVRRDSGDVRCIGTSIERLIPSPSSIDRAVCVLAVDHMSSPVVLLKHLRPALRVSGEIVVVFQDPDEELKLRDDPDYFEFDSAARDTIFRVPSKVKNLRDFEKYLPEGYQIATKIHQPSGRFGVASLIGVRCIRVS